MFAQLLVASALAFNAPASMVSRSAVAARTELSMSTKYTVAAGVAKKKGKTGQSIDLKGYRVGGRAPNSAVKSGTTSGEQSLWNKIFGGSQIEYKQAASMNTRDTGPKAKNKAKTGDSTALKGYKVGMRDPQGLGAGIGAMKRSTKRI